MTTMWVVKGLMAECVPNFSYCCFLFTEAISTKMLETVILT